MQSADKSVVYLLVQCDANFTAESTQVRLPGFHTVYCLPTLLASISRMALPPAGPQAIWHTRRKVHQPLCTLELLLRLAYPQNVSRFR